MRRGGKEYNIGFRGGERITSKLEVVGTVGQRNTGTTVRFWPDPKFFDTDKFSVPQLKHVLKAKAVLCPACASSLRTRLPAKHEWFYTGDLRQYLVDESRPERALLPAEPIQCWQARAGARIRSSGRSAWAPILTRSRGELRQPDSDHRGRHARKRHALGLAAAVREFCEFRNLLPRGVKLAPEDVWDGLLFVLSMKIQRAAVCRPDEGAAEFARCAAAGRRFRQGCLLAVAEPAHRMPGEKIAQRDRERAGAPGRPRRSCSASASQRAGAARQAGRLRQTDPAAASCSWSRATRPVVRPSRRATRISRPSCRCAARS
jgi:topoisomerase-4 subunit B